MDNTEELAKVRQRIDDIDEQVQRLIEERARCAQQVATLKGQSQDVTLYRPEREAQVLRRVMQRNQGVLPAEAMVRIFREIMSSCLALEQSLQVAFLGPEGTFTQQAALKHFGHAVLVSSQVTIEDVFRAVASQRCHYGVIPVENSTEGSVSQTLDLFRQSPLKICGEVVLRIHHQLLSKAPDLHQVQKIYGHQQALAQCRAWLDANAAKIEQVAVSSNAEAARRAAQESGTAAIASAAAAEIYGLSVIVSNIEDEPDNTTRFLVIGRSYPAPSGHDKTSLLVVTGNQSGALHRVLSPFAQHNVSMTRIESRPSRRGAWDYVFFIDLEGHVQDQSVATALAELAHEASTVKVLGAYPRAVL